MPFIAVGVPRTAFLTNAMVGQVFLIAAAATHPRLVDRVRLRNGLLGVALVAQTAVSLPEVIEWTTPDPRRIRAETIAAAAPADAVLFTRWHAHYLTYYTEAPAHSLDHLVRDTRLTYGPDANVGHRVLLEAWRERHAGRRPLILSEGLRYLRSLGFDQTSLPVDESERIPLGVEVAFPILTPDGEPPGGD